MEAGVPLRLRINVLDATSGNAVNGAHVDIWHANANGLYSDEASQQTRPGSTSGSTKGQNFLRGYQVTGQDAGVGTSPVDGQVSFLTIWPGWYTGRAIHIHVRVRTYDTSGTAVTSYTTHANGQLAAGTHSLRVAVPAGLASGLASVELTLADAAGNTRVLKKSVHVPSA